MIAVAAAVGCAPDDRYAQCEPGEGDCGTYEVGDETWRYACVTVETASSSGSFCTRECTGSCSTLGGHEGVCFRFSAGEDRFCYQRCERDDDCYASSRCTDALRDDGWRGRLCMPDQGR